MAFKHSTRAQTGRKLQAFDIQLNAFGELVTSIKVEEINNFLNETMVDKKINHIVKVGQEKYGLGK